MPAAALSNVWRIGGNAGTTAGVHFLGTTDNQPVMIKANGQQVMRIEPTAGGPNVIGGWQGNIVSNGVTGATVWGGNPSLANKVGANDSTISGGIGNTATGIESTVGGGSANTASGVDSTVAGGSNNRPSGVFSTVGGGFLNTASGNGATIPGGLRNHATNFAFAAGVSAEANHPGSFVWAGNTSVSDPIFESTRPQQFLIHAPGGAAIGTNDPQGHMLRVAGRIKADGGFVGDGSQLTGLPFSTNATGTIRSTGTSAGSGSYNGMIESYYGPGDRYGLAQLPNGVTALYTAGTFAPSSIQLGLMNGAINFQPQMTINHAGNVGIGTTTPESALHVGSYTAGADQFATVSTAGANQFQSGVRLRHFNGGFGWTLTSDERDSTFRLLSHYNDFNGIPRLTVERTSGNVGIGTTTPTTKLDVAGEITATAVNITSDRNAKEQFKPVNAREVLEKVVGLPISEWQYKTQTDARHIGPMAQDFREAFALGRDEKHITSVDADGVALAAIQGLNELVQEQRREITELQQRNRELEQRLAGRLEMLERLMEKQAAQVQP